MVVSIAVLYKVVRKGLTENIISERELEAEEGASHAYS